MKLTNQDANITFRYSMLIKIRVLQRRNKINYCVCQKNDPYNLEKKITSAA